MAVHPLPSVDRTGDHQEVAVLLFAQAGQRIDASGIEVGPQRVAVASVRRDEGRHAVLQQRCLDPQVGVLRFRASRRHLAEFGERVVPTAEPVVVHGGHDMWPTDRATTTGREHPHPGQGVGRLRQPVQVLQRERAVVQQVELPHGRVRIAGDRGECPVDVCQRGRVVPMDGRDVPEFL